MADDARIAGTAQFQSPLPETFNWPEGCCVCGKSVTHNEKISVTRQSHSGAVVAAGTGVVSSTSLTVEVPHCDVHRDGAKLEGSKGNWKIRFRSYPFLRAFCALNGTVPG